MALIGCQAATNVHLNSCYGLYKSTVAVSVSLLNKQLGCLRFLAAVTHPPPPSPPPLPPTQPLICDTHDIPGSVQKPLKSSNFNYVRSCQLHTCHTILASYNYFGENLAWLLCQASCRELQCLDYFKLKYKMRQ